MQQEDIHLILETIVAVFQTNGRMLNWGDDFSAAFGLTGARMQVLGNIAWDGVKKTAPQIAEELAISRQGVQKQLNLLVGDGVLQKIPNPGNVRSPFYFPTEEGMATYRKIYALWEAHARTIGQNFSREDLLASLRVLNQLAALHQGFVPAGLAADEEEA